MAKPRRGAILAAVPIVASALGLIGSAGTAAAVTWQYAGMFEISVGATGYCLDSNTNGKGNNVGAVYTLPCNGGYYQKWALWINAASPIQEELTDYQTGRCLDSNSGGSTYALPCNNGLYQTWTATHVAGAPSGWLLITDVATGLSLDANGAKVDCVTRDENDSKYQSWAFNATAP